MPAARQHPPSTRAASAAAGTDKVGGRVGLDRPAIVRARWDADIPTDAFAAAIAFEQLVRTAGFPYRRVTATGETGTALLGERQRINPRAGRA